MNPQTGTTGKLEATGAIEDGASTQTVFVTVASTQVLDRSCGIVKKNMHQLEFQHQSSTLYAALNRSMGSFDEPLLRPLSELDPSLSKFLVLTESLLTSVASVTRLAGSCKPQAFLLNARLLLGRVIGFKRGITIIRSATSCGPESIDMHAYGRVVLYKR
jgi:hypothetical protein